MEIDLARQAAQARQALEECDALLIAAGAGMGVDSGLPDFRGTEGFWRAYPAFARLGLHFQAIANPRWFDTDPHLAWGFYGHRRNLYQRATPHRGFAHLLNWARKKGEFFVFTSNVDGHFQRAGFDPERIVECHGSIHHTQCARPCSDQIRGDDTVIELDETTMRARDPLPLCPHCGKLARPNVLMFGDSDWIADRTDQQTSRFDRWVDALQHEGRKLAIVECGAGTAVPTVRLTCEHLASRLEATLIRINPREPQVPPGGIAIPLRAAEALDALAWMK